MRDPARNLLLTTFLTAPFALMGCSPECVDVSDCAGKASAEGRDYTCTSGKCTPGSPFPDAGAGGGGAATGGGTGGGAMGGGGGAAGGGGGVDAGPDAGTDAGIDAGTDAGIDAGTDAGIDAGTDAGIDAGTDAGIDAGTGPTAELAQARDHADSGVMTPVSISAATVTYLKPPVGTEDAGFFIQAGAMGPAIFVAIDPASLTPAPQVGDSVGFTATGFGWLTGVSSITALSNWNRLSSGGSVTTFTQDLTAHPTVSASLGELESELITIRGTLDAGFGTAGAPYVAAFLATSANPADDLRFRAPQSMVDALDLQRGCDITVGPSPMWRFNAQAQPSAWVNGDVTVNSCPAPVVINATGAISRDSVRVDFSRRIAPASVTADGSQFTFDNGLTASAASVAGRSVTILTSPQDGGTTYRVTAAATITDTRGTGLGMPNSYTFLAVRPNDCTARVVISQVYGGGGNPGAPFRNDFVELHNRSATAIDLSGWSVQQASSTGTFTRFPIAGIIPPGGFFLIQGGSGGTVGAALPTPDVTSTFDFSAGSAKIILTDATITTGLATPCPTGAGIVDMIGFGSAANCFERAFGPGHTNELATIRMQFAGPELSCFDTNTNDTDFVLNPPGPRNSSTASLCTLSCPGL